VLVAEVWAGQERGCAHRCEQHDSDCPITLGISRAAAEIDGLQEGAYGHWLNEMCTALQSTSRSEREKAKDALARLQQLSDHAEISPPSAEQERDERAAQAAVSSLRSELLLLSNKALRQRAVDADVSFDDIEDARESKQELVELIVAQEVAASSKQSHGESRSAIAAAKNGTTHVECRCLHVSVVCLGRAYHAVCCCSAQDGDQQPRRDPREPL
jgi:hypothetical protein